MANFLSVFPSLAGALTKGYHLSHSPLNVQQIGEKHTMLT